MWPSVGPMLFCEPVSTSAMRPAEWITKVFTEMRGGAGR